MSDTLHDPCSELALSQAPAILPCRERARPWILLVTILGSSMAFIDGSVVNMVLPILQREMQASATQAQWLIESYALFMAALILVGGSLGDLYGHRKIFSIGVVSFALASLLCGLAQTPNQLIVARALQGIGGALLVPGSLAIISANFDAKERGAAIGTWSAATALTMAVGPVLGAWLADTFSWRWIFFMNLPLALAILVVIAWRVPETRKDNCAALDKYGAVLGTLALGLLTFALIESNRYGLAHPLTLGTFAGGVVLLTLFFRQQTRTPSPIVPLNLFASRNFSGANLMTFFLYSALGGAFFFIPFYLVNILGYSTTEAAMAFLPFVVVMSVLSRYSGMLADRFGARLPLTIGPLITALGYGLLVTANTQADYWTDIFPAIFIQGIGMAITVAPLTTTVMNSVSEAKLGIASGINNMVSRTASLLAIAVFGIVFLVAADSMYAEIITASDISPAILDQAFGAGDFLAPPQVEGANASAVTALYETIFVSAFGRVMVLATALAALSGVLSFFMIARR